MKNSFIKMNVRDVFKSLTLSLLTLALSVGTLYAATTVGANIDTDGTLLINNATSTITNLSMINSTTTNATTTGYAAFTGGLIANFATSTINNLNMVKSTSTNATTTTLSASGTGQFAGTLSAGTTTVSGANELVASGAAAANSTTTLFLSSGGTRGSCLQMTASGGASTSNWRIYISTVPGDTDNLAVEAGLCK